MLCTSLPCKFALFLVVFGFPFLLPNDKKDVPLQAIIGAVRFYVASTGGLTITERLNKET